MFGRRTKKTKGQKLRDSLWPSMGLQRLAQYYHYRMARLTETPYAIAAGFANGVAVSFTPFIGLHLLLGALATWAMRGSMIPMLIGSLVGNPWTLPFIWVATYKLGRAMLGKTAYVSKIPGQFVITDLLDKPVELLLPMTLGCLPFVAVSWTVSFFVIRNIIRKHRTGKPPRGGRREGKA